MPYMPCMVQKSKKINHIPLQAGHTRNTSLEKCKQLQRVLSVSFQNYFRILQVKSIHKNFIPIINIFFR
jgi:hypothetical protein